jgi:hypothetical protein
LDPYCPISEPNDGGVGCVICCRRPNFLRSSHQDWPAKPSTSAGYTQRSLVLKTSRHQRHHRPQASTTLSLSLKHRLQTTIRNVAPAKRCRSRKPDEASSSVVTKPLATEPLQTAIRTSIPTGIEIRRAPYPFSQSNLSAHTRHGHGIGPDLSQLIPSAGSSEQDLHPTTTGLGNLGHTLQECLHLPLQQQQ